MKKNLLIYWTSRTFVEIFGPLIPKLAENFKIVIIILEYSTPPGMVEFLDSWKKEGIIEEYLLTPNHRKMLELHLFMKSVIKKLKVYKFDLWFTGSDMQVPERYIQECILPKECISLVLWQNITYLLMYDESLVRNLLKGTEINKILFPIQNQQLDDRFRKRSLAERIKETKTLSDFLRKAINYIRRVFRLPQRKLRLYCERFVLPLVLAGKIFRLGPYDNLTQVSSGRSNAVIFTDEVEAQAHKLLLKTPNIYVAQYPTYGSCQCNGNRKDKTAILSPLSGFVGRDKISQEALSLFFRDFKTILAQTNTKSIHLRIHPDETGSWYIQLRDYLTKHGIDTCLVDCRRPIREIICDYVGMAGYASAALRDGRAGCNYAFVIGFAGISRFQFNNPKFVFGKSEGIGWIHEDGSYDQEIFSRKRFIPPERKSVPEILKELSKKTRQE